MYAKNTILTSQTQICPCCRFSSISPFLLHAQQKMPSNTKYTVLILSLSLVFIVMIIIKIALIDIDEFFLSP